MMFRIRNKLEEIRDTIVEEELEQAVALLDELIDIFGDEEGSVDRDARDAIAYEIGNDTNVLDEDNF